MRVLFFFFLSFAIPQPDLTPRCEKLPVYTIVLSFLFFAHQLVFQNFHFCQTIASLSTLSTKYGDDWLNRFILYGVASCLLQLIYLTDWLCQARSNRGPPSQRPVSSPFMESMGMRVVRELNIRTTADAKNIYLKVRTDPRATSFQKVPQPQLKMLMLRMNMVANVLIDLCKQS